MKYGLLTYEENKSSFNVGDYIQSLAAMQFLPRVDELLNRDSLSEYNGSPIKLIMNGWFTHNIHNWIPSDNINPLFVSFHINNTAAPFILNSKGVSYLKKHEPIGCRDQFTEKILLEKGIEGYFTGCLTLTLDNYKVDNKERGDKVYIVDPLYNYPSWSKITYDYKSFLRSFQNRKIFNIRKKQKHLLKVIDRKFFDEAICINQELPSNTYTDEQKFTIAKNLLHRYAKAKLIITSRIHCALPCLALGTPVIFINGFDSFVDTCRFDGVLDLFNRIDINTKTGEWSSNFILIGKINSNTEIKNLERHHILAETLKKRCKAFIEKE